MKLVYLFLVIILYQFGAIYCTDIAVKNGKELVDELCSQKAREFLHIELNSSYEYIVEVNCSCVVNIRQSVVINSVGPLPVASVNCKQHDSKFPSVGFAFRDSSFSISHVQFIGCGTFLSSFNADFINSTLLKFSSTHAALFFFFNSSVDFKHVRIQQYFGFAIVGINIRQSNFEKLLVSDTTGNVYAYGQPIGSGLLFIFTGSFKHTAKPRVKIVNSIFNANYDFTESDKCVSSHFRYFLNPRIINAAALTVLFNVQNSVHQPSVYIDSSLFAHNSGSYCGGLLIAMLNSTDGLVNISNGTVFKKNYNYHGCEGSALVFYATGTLNSLVTPLIIHDTKFSKQRELITGNQADHSISGTAFIGVHSSITRYLFLIKKTNFTKNIGYSQGGTCLSVVKFDDNGIEVKVDVYLYSVIAHSNFQTLKKVYFPRGGSFTFNNIDNVFINGSSTSPSVFSYNHGSVIQTWNTYIHLHGYITFNDNQAFKGAALLLYNSLLYFKDGLNLVMNNNSVHSTGGAIYSMSWNNYVFDLPNCALQLQSDNITCNFINNTAVVGGSSVFAYPLYSCYELKTEKLVTSSSYYTQRFNFSTKYNSTINEISTKASEVVDYHKYSSCKRTSGVHFPGQTISLHACALDHTNGTCVYAVVEVSLSFKDGGGNFKESYSTISNSEKVQFLKESTCSIVNVTITYLDDTDATMNESLKAVLSSQDHFLPLDLNFISNCPPGFDIHQGVCICGKTVMEFYKAMHFYEETYCNINTLSFYKPDFVAAPWVGNIYDEKIDEKLFGITDLCPFDCCRTNFSMNKLVYNTAQSSFQLSDGQTHVNICRDHREGTLCGKCSKGYSVVFGSSDCMVCSNWWLLTIAVYAVIGPLLIYILYTLNLTITTGTVNGILFYAQAANVGILPFLNYFPNTWLLSKLFNIFLSTLNFNLGFRVCFYNEMNEIQKTGLTLIFPFYLLMIVVLIIVVSRYSTWLSNKTSSSSIQVLVTVSHISVSKLSVTIIDVFTPVTVYVGNSTKKVWFRDGNVGFYDGSNVQLFILMGLTVVSVAIVLVPYFVLLIGGRFLIRRTAFHNRSRAVYEALHGPYKENRRFWFLMRQVLLMIMFVTYSALRGIAIHLVILATLLLLVLFTIAQEHLKPFKSKLIGILDLSIMLNLVLIYSVAWFQAGGLRAPHLQVLYIFVSILMIIVFFTFLLVLCYHVLLLCQSFKCVKCYMNRRKTDAKESLLTLSNCSLRGSSYDKEREPLIYFD